MHTQLHLADALDAGAAVLDTWPIDLRGWSVDR
jgi:hypothetical protein